MKRGRWWRCAELRAPEIAQRALYRKSQRDPPSISGIIGAAAGIITRPA